MYFPLLGSMYDEDEEPSPIPRRKLIRSSSDPSIATGENVPGIPPYPAPPSYRRDKQVYSRPRYNWTVQEKTKQKIEHQFFQQKV